MRNRLIRRRFLALAILFLLFTGAFAPVAFFAGLARGNHLGTAQAAASQNGANDRSNSPFAGHYSGQEIICGWNGKVSDPQLEAFCHPFLGSGQRTGAAPSGSIASQSAPSRPVRLASAGTQPSSALNSAVNAAVAGIAANNSSAPTNIPGNPLSLALAPDGGNTLNPWDSSVFSGGGGIPNVVSPGLLTGLAPSNNGQGGSGTGGGTGANTGGGAITDPVVTPLPAAIVLWIPGLMGLLAMMRQRKTAAV